MVKRPGTGISPMEWDNILGKKSKYDFNIDEQIKYWNTRKIINIIEKIIFSSIEEINAQLPSERQLAKSAKTVLFGKNGQLDSLGLVNLLVIIEQNIEDQFDTSIIIADERAMSQKNSPFRTIGTLAEYLNMILNEV